MCIDLSRPALFIGESPETPIYAIHTVSEASLKLRSTRRVAEHLRLETSEEAILRAPVENFTFEVSTSDLGAWEYSGSAWTEKHGRDAFWPQSALGFYTLSAEFPRFNPAWSPQKRHSSGNRLFRLTDLSTQYGLV